MGVITDPKQFYRFAASDIWADINPELGEHLRIAEGVREYLVIYNKSYPPPSPGWRSTLGTVILVGACCCVVGAAFLGSGGVITASTSAVTSSTNVAVSVNTAAASAAASTGTTIAGSTITAAEVGTFAAKAVGTVGGVAKTIGGITGNTTAQKIANAADTISGSTSFTEGVMNVYKEHMKSKNLTVSKEGDRDLRALAFNEQQQYANFLRREAQQTEQKPDEKLPSWVIPVAGIGVALLSKG